MRQDTQSYVNTRRAYFEDCIEQNRQTQISDLASQCDRTMIMSELQNYMTGEKWNALNSKKAEYSCDQLFDMLTTLKSVNDIS